MSLDEVPPPGTALVEELDKRLLVQLRDGRKILGILRWEQQICRISGLLPACRAAPYDSPNLPV